MALAACGDYTPTVPGDFEVEAKSSSSISLTWTRSTNHGGIAHYEVWRDSSYIDKSSTTGYMDTGLANSTTFCYAVRAVGDKEGTSDFTDTLCTETFPYDDTGPPTVPMALIANAVSDTEIELTWDPSTDDLQVVGYKMFRDNDFINSVASNMFNDIGLVNSTRYCYYVTAYDRLNQQSGASTTDCAVTLSP